MTKVINIASLRKPAAVVIETEDGKKHEMVPASVAVFLENLKEVEALGLNASPVQEAELIVKVISRSFPTIDIETLNSWPLDIVRNLYVTVISANGEVVSQDEAVIEEAKKTGKSQPGA
ncbi:hypothetical protein B9J07_27555 [Sinorhizobium sp. LM21]|uniref:hypothetical protein n=1 Tax=Sinorhizobium sp. LM21 TaxID=1449788 RepID=UPI0005D819A0|nr:hypothetical protein [Sinorhizobium sp. LM21]AJW30247.1 hypothetical protein pLM21S1_p129 [Sinorhizobium sp. LM21]OWZ90348.1 hypothetical protein B9J07_27555 [Sinorhizobium sp. LM21]